MQTVQNLNCKIVNATSRHEGRISVHEKWEPGHKGQLKLGGGGEVRGHHCEQSDVVNIA